MASRFDPEHEKELVRRAQRGDADARGELVRLHEGTIQTFVRRYPVHDMPESRMRMNAIKLVNEAIDTYDPKAGTQPSTWIQSRLRKMTRSQEEYNSFVRVPTIATLVTPYKMEVRRLRDELGRHPSPAEIQQAMAERQDKHLTLKQVRRLQRAVVGEGSGNRQVGGEDDDDGMEISELEQGRHAPDLAERAAEADRRDEWLQHVKALPRVQRTILSHSLGLPGHRKMSERDMALDFGMSTYEVRKHLDAARAAIAAHYGAAEAPKQP